MAGWLASYERRRVAASMPSHMVPYGSSSRRAVPALGRHLMPGLIEQPLPSEASSE
jgi:hypothetical protein